MAHSILDRIKESAPPAPVKDEVTAGNQFYQAMMADVKTQATKDAIKEARGEFSTQLVEAQAKVTEATITRLRIRPKMPRSTSSMA